MGEALELTGGSVRQRPRVPVLLPVALDQTYDYAIPDGAELAPGTFILVPFGPQQRIGVVWHHTVGPEKPLDERKLKGVIAPVDVPPLPPGALDFAEWIANYTLSPLGMVLRMMMGAQAAFDPPKPKMGVALVAGAPEPPRMTPARKRAIEIASDGLVRAKSALAHEAGCTTGVIDGLVKAGMLVDVLIPDRGFPTPRSEHADVTFDGDQAIAVEALGAAMSTDAFSVALIDGVTG
ncbi:MAG: primosomal protein N', partial [Pseudomonadota bacterium]